MKPQIIIFGVMLFVLVGCAASPPANPSPTQAAAATKAQSAATAVELRPTVHTGLEASDPAKFTLAAGKLQLVEFFAFW